MSGYFTALGRSAGSVRQQREPSSAPGIAEQEVGRVSDSPNVERTLSALSHPESTTMAAEISDDGSGPGAQRAVTQNEPTGSPTQQRMSTPADSPSREGISRPTASPQQRRFMAPTSPGSASADLPEALIRNAAANAALRWVAADPARPRREAAHSQPRTREGSDSLDAESTWIGIQAAPAGEPRETQRREETPLLTADATVVDRHAAETSQPQEERVEVRIDTIHVRVDAPSPPPVIAQPMQALQPKVEPREERSSNFSRCRVPRI